MNRVVTIQEWNNRELIAGLREMLNKAEAGQITGLVFAAKFGEQQHGIGLLGDYAVDVVPVLAVADRLRHLVHKQLDERHKCEPAATQAILHP